VNNTSHSIELIMPSLQSLQDFLGVSAEISKDEQIAIADGLVFQISNVSKSSGFLSTEFVLSGVMTIATTTASGLLTTWLQERLKRHPKARAKLDGKDVAVEDE
jgi:hypothetical protein